MSEVMGTVRCSVIRMQHCHFPLSALNDGLTTLILPFLLLKVPLLILNQVVCMCSASCLTKAAVSVTTLGQGLLWDRAFIYCAIHDVQFPFFLSEKFMEGLMSKFLLL
jgi:hypothetical protein